MYRDEMPRFISAKLLIIFVSLIQYMEKGRYHII